MKLIPMPKTIRRRAGVCNAAALSIVLPAGTDRRLACHAGRLKARLEDLTGQPVRLTAAEAARPLRIRHGAAGDGYVLEIAEDGVDIAGDGPAGAFYGLQTLDQLLSEFGAALPCLRIEDRPDYADRGFYHDVSRGRVPTLEQLRHMVRELARLKVNCLELYVESNYEFVECRGITGPGDRLSTEEILALDDYCHLHFIELVPSLSTFGHLHDLLSSERYRHLCELPDYRPTEHYWMEKMDHHTIDVSNPESLALICALMDQYIPLFRSNRFNICCDETFDLCTGRNAGKDAAEEYVRFVGKLIEHLKRRGKTVQMWGDIVLNHPEQAAALPADVVFLNWCYLKEPVEAHVRFFARCGHPQVVCPGTSAWNRFVEEIDRSTGNITKMARCGLENGAAGLLNTNWGDFGAICGWNSQQFGVALGAEKAWNALGGPDGDFDAAVSALLYDQIELNMAQLLRDLGDCERTAEWAQIVPWLSARRRGAEKPLDVDPPRIRAHIARCRELAETFADLGDDPRYQDLALTARAVGLLNETVLLRAGEGDRAAVRAGWEAWLPAYEAAWLRECKPGQLHRVGQFLRELTEAV
ncbi:MAG: family 20 glycosylhydrolase [Oscillospiraceae bacterium]|nr:family 20 glycosylhydrolase [Oscillospiraceae bacterium]